MAEHRTARQALAHAEPAFREAAKERASAQRRLEIGIGGDLPPFDPRHEVFVDREDLTSQIATAQIFGNDWGMASRWRTVRALLLEQSIRGKGATYHALPPERLQAVLLGPPVTVGQVRWMLQSFCEDGMLERRDLEGLPLYREHDWIIDKQATMEQEVAATLREATAEDLASAALPGGWSRLLSRGSYRPWIWRGAPYLVFALKMLQFGSRR